MWEDTKIFQVLSIRFLLKLFFALLIYINIRVHTNLSKNGFCKKRKEKTAMFRTIFPRKLGRSTMSVNLLENYTTKGTVIKVLIKIMFAYDRSPSMQWCVLELHNCENAFSDHG